MPNPTPPTHQHRHHHHHGGDIYHQVRRGSSAYSSTSSLSDDQDAITPCPLEVTGSTQQHHPQSAQAPQPQQRRRPQEGMHRKASWRDSIQGGAPHHLEGLERRPEDDYGTSEACYGSQVDEETLWRRMLAIQRVFGCYNSARMRAALEMGGDSSGFIPSRTCLDLLNDSIDQLPEESKRRLEEFLETGDTSLCHPAAKRKSWRQRLMSSPPLLQMQMEQRL
ncbi:hypothetical protein QBC37DRAFT_140733 [Rhypophila decipiens]|uniref:Uncharacterized protein n=1 Tax=Rhypophila decipiens TaxID=261697 RepID=A0AAN7BBJ9_9PEZI|nr:hypothetical protein QBC37DRAFT_140733 [Rhypophila decipiens]